MPDTPRAWTSGRWWVEPSYTNQWVDMLWNVSVGNPNDCQPVAIDCEAKADAQADADRLRLALDGLLRHLSEHPSNWPHSDYLFLIAAAEEALGGDDE